MRLNRSDWAGGGMGAGDGRVADLLCHLSAMFLPL